MASIMRKNIVFAALIFMVLIAMNRNAAQEFAVGQRLKLWGGYDPEPQWLAGKEFHIGTVERFISGQNKKKAMVVRLDSPITAGGVTEAL